MKLVLDMHGHLSDSYRVSQASSRLLDRADCTGVSRIQIIVVGEGLGCKARRTRHRWRCGFCTLSAALMKFAHALYMSEARTEPSDAKMEALVIVWCRP